MTTIAWDGEYLYSDSQSTADNTKSKCVKLFRAGKARLAFTGEVHRFPALVAAVAAGEDPLPLLGSETRMFHVLDGVLTIYDDGDSWTETAPAFAGSGSQFARGAHAAGASVAQAVRIAADLDLYSGGPVRRLRA
ncbi:peptidase HslV family [Xylella phage Paz]|uniref:Uncharacterized protein n=1 Tax=Xylella phage Paz TaxID=1415145 RepID=V5Q7S9_9CAUD|nr:peptidase HslV family [Xylella phage Paz]AHB12148.1 hypothetical protein Paz_51 [Xylella phage Paz]